MARVLLLSSDFRCRTRSGSLGVPAGIPASSLREARENITPGVAVALILVPAIAGVLGLGLACRWGQIFPRWLAPLAGRRVPPLLALVPASMATVALTSYGLIGIWLMGHALATGTTTWTDLARGWGVTGTELIFLVWGVCLGVATAGYYLVTETDDPTVPAGHSRHRIFPT
jgi:hypothetical protein